MKEDKILYEKFLSGNEEAFDKLIIKYKNNLIYFITRYVKSLEIAEDIFQDVVLYILENKKNSNKITHFSENHLFSIQNSSI